MNQNLKASKGSSTWDRGNCRGRAQRWLSTAPATGLPTCLSPCRATYPRSSSLALSNFKAEAFLIIHRDETERSLSTRGVAFLNELRTGTDRPFKVAFRRVPSRCGPFHTWLREKQPTERKRLCSGMGHGPCPQRPPTVPHTRVALLPGQAGCLLTPLFTHYTLSVSCIGGDRH